MSQRNMTDVTSLAGRLKQQPKQAKTATTRLKLPLPNRGTIGRWAMIPVYFIRLCDKLILKLMYRRKNDTANIGAYGSPKCNPV